MKAASGMILFFFSIVLSTSSCAHNRDAALVPCPESFAAQDPPAFAAGGVQGSGPPPFYRVPQSGALEEKALAIDPDSVTEKDIKEVLSQFPAPRIINIDGSIPVISMDSFSRFLISMGYPEESVRDPITGSYSYSSYTGSERLAGLIAWYYEREGMMPMLIGHSQGGMLAIRVLYELTGEFHLKIPVLNPCSGAGGERYEITDPLTGAGRTVVGLKVGFASAIATGRLMRVILGQWGMLSRLRRIPDSVEEFTGFHIKNDPIGGDLFGLIREDRYYPAGSALVRNVMLPAEYSHIRIPLTEGLAKDPVARRWIDAFGCPTENTEPVHGYEGKGDNILFAADIWHSIKKRWCIELQRLILARRDRNMEVTTHAG